jgi:protein-S-isoprenylcysteine O-methyltransferase Ste14
MTPFFVSGCLYAGWIMSWVLAALWSRRTTARPPSSARLLDLGLTIAGAGLIAFAARRRSLLGESWAFPMPVEWVLSGLVLLGLVFTWWARLTLGDLWSGAVVRKEAHEVVRRGPYRLVRHPIYTGLILALLALAMQIGRPAGVVGAALIAVGLWAKARLEESFLGVDLGADYADYRRITPMLIPFWRLGR